MDPLGETTPDSGAKKSQADLDFEGKRAFAAVVSRLTGRGPGLRLGRYKVQEPLGQGGFATVYAGYDPKLDRRVAIKLLRASRATSEAQERMIREAQSLAQLGHPNVVQIFDVGYSEGESGDRSVYIVMELLEGPTLDDWRADDQPPLAAILDAYCEAAQGLAAAHAVGVVHRDFKPSNAMFGADGRVKVLDFGLARAHGMTSELDSGPTDAEQAPVSLTQTGIVMGTPRYMAPEQHKAEPTTERSDQYSLCVALWEALAGVPPFGGTTVVELATEKREGVPPRPPGTPRHVYRALAQGLDREPLNRHSDMQALVAALRSRGHKRWVVAGASVAAFAGLASVAASHAPPAVCREALPDLAPRFAAVVEAVTPEPNSERWGVQEQVRLRLHRFVDQWQTTRESVCESGVLSNAERQAMAGCLARGADRFEALVDTLATDPGERALRQLLALSVPELCTAGHPDDQYLVDPAREDQLDAYAAMARTWASKTERIDSRTLDRELAAATKLGDDYIIARLLFGRSMQALYSGQPERAAEELQQALWRAEGARDPLLATELMPGTIGHLIDSGATPAELQPHFDRARSLLEAAGYPAARHAEFLALESIAASRRADPKAALELATRASEIAGDPPLPGAEDAVALATVGAMTIQGGELPAHQVEKTLLRVLDQANEQAHWYQTSAAIANHTLAELALERNDLDDALAHSMASISAMGQAGLPDNASVLYMLSHYGRTLSMAGSDTLGLALMQQSYERIADTLGPMNLRLSIIAEQIVEANFERGRPDLALPWAKKQLAHEKNQFGEDDPATVWGHLNIALALTRIGRVADAEAAMNEALAIDGGQETDDSRAFLLQLRGELRLAQGHYLDARTDLLAAASEMDPSFQGPRDRGSLGEMQAAAGVAMEKLGDAEDGLFMKRLAVVSMRDGSFWHRQRADALEATLPPQDP